MKQLKNWGILMLMVMAMPLMVACNQSPEQKAEALIKEQLKKALYKPDTYKPIDTKVDSAFAPYDDPKTFAAIKELMTISNEAMSLEEEMQVNKKHMAIYSGPYQTALDKIEFAEAKEKFEDNSAKHEKLMKKVQEKMQDVVAIFKSEREFIGFKAIHNFRADNNEGNTLIDNGIFYMDKDMNKIIYTMDEDEYKEMQYAIKKVKEEILGAQ